MIYSLAPMEGITGYIYRNAMRRHFGGFDRYYTPFISPTSSHSLKTKELRDIQPENNAPDVIPQVLTNDADAFNWSCEKLTALGYSEVNLNLGCPSNTVVKKGRGAGFLPQLDRLERFMDDIFARPIADISVKTRIGLDSADILPRLMQIYNNHPLTELIIHPRLQVQFYKGLPDMQAFEYALSVSRHPVIYNGDVFSPEDAARIARYDVVGIMLGRGAIADPALARRINGGEPASREELSAFLEEILTGYMAMMRDENNAVCRMKEIWSYLGQMFPDGDRALKRIRKCSSIQEYRSAVDQLLS